MPETTSGAVIIGRNEGDRLRKCLASVMPLIPFTGYVDSGSRDGSEAMARVMGADTHSLEMASSFTAARARNAGFERLLSLRPHIRFVQFVDGDCEMMESWKTAALAYLDAHPNCAAVCGRRRERHPERSVYNRLCDVEWNTPVGDTLRCGGDALFRTEAFTQVGGFRDDLIAGEEPELCLRLRRSGWQVHRLDQEMTLHDAAITSWGQWWRRTVRGGLRICRRGLAARKGAGSALGSRNRTGAFLGLLIPFAHPVAGDVRASARRAALADVSPALAQAFSSRRQSRAGLSVAGRQVRGGAGSTEVLPHQAARPQWATHRVQISTE